MKVMQEKVESEASAGAEGGPADKHSRRRGRLSELNRQSNRFKEQNLSGESQKNGHRGSVPGLEKTLAESVEEALQGYFDYLGGEPTTGLYQLVMNEVEAPLLKIVMTQAGGNQCKAAALLGLNRGTLRKKLQQYGLK